MQIEDTGIERLLIIEPHADDMILICAGLVKGLSDLGKKIYVVTFTCGSTSYSDRFRKQREQESAKADEILGVTKREIWKYETRKCWRNADSLYDDLLSAIRRLQPNMIITTHLDKKHPDHRFIATCIEELAYQASEPIEKGYGPLVKAAVWLGESPRAKLQKPNTFIDITKTYQFKEDALKTQESQLPILGKGIFKGMKSLATERAKQYDPRVQYAEAFQALKINHWQG